MSDAAYHWVTIARFFNPAEALFFQQVLEGHDIPAFVRNEHLGQLMPHLTLANLEGGIQLQVPSDCVEAALDILEGHGADGQDNQELDDSPDEDVYDEEYEEDFDEEESS